MLITRFLQSHRSFDNYHVCVAALALASKSKDRKVVVYLNKDYKVEVYLRLVVRQLVTQQ